MNSLIIIALIAAGFGFIIVLFKILKKVGKFALKLPTNFLIIFATYALVGLSGFILKDGIIQRPILLGILIMLVSLTFGILYTYKLNVEWEWSQEATFGKKLLYLSGLTITGLCTFVIIFLLSEFRGWPRFPLSSDIVWWFALLTPTMLLPLFIGLSHQYWNQIPLISQLQHIFQLPIGGSPPFIESGGISRIFHLIIPLQFDSKEIWKSKVAVPPNKTLGEVFHYKLHEHNVIKSYAKKIAYAENNQRSKVYGWSFYRIRKIWWGWRIKKYYLDPYTQVGKIISQNESIYVERVKTWK